MSHYHLEVIMPPTDDVEKAIEQILAPFNESGKDEDGEPNRHTFWDWYVIGGRWSGAKVEAMFDKERLAEFRQKLVELKITVSGFQAGKQTLQPASQIPEVDSLWNKLFPESPVKQCPMFSHFNDQYAKNSGVYGDILPISDIPKRLTASRVIIASHAYDGNGFKAEYMIEDSIWNGVSWVDTKWDGTVATALEEYKNRIESYKAEWREKNEPNANWLVVTVDYHN